MNNIVFFSLDDFILYSEEKQQKHNENKPSMTWGVAEYISHLTFFETLPLGRWVPTDT